jgi:hypothetical protein
MPPFISCPACGCPSKAHELVCPHCGVTLKTDGSLKKTAVAIALGLAVAACGDDTTGGGGFAAEYGVAGSDPGGAPVDGGAPGIGGDTATGGTTGDGGNGEGGFAAEYGVPGTGGAGGGR